MQFILCVIVSSAVFAPNMWPGWLSGDWIFILQINICHVLTASAKHNKYDGANNSDGQETTDSHNGDHIIRQRCSLILASNSFWIYTNNKTSWYYLTSHFDCKSYVFDIKTRFGSTNYGWKTQRKEILKQLYSYEGDWFRYSERKLLIDWLIIVSGFLYLAFKVARNSFQHFPRPRFWTVIITTLYQLMLQSWYQKTAQSLVNTLVLFSWHNMLP